MTFAATEMFMRRRDDDLVHATNVRNIFARVRVIGLDIDIQCCEECDERKKPTECGLFRPDSGVG